jgi:hypothetical protein
MMTKQRIKIEPEWKELIPEEKEKATEPKITVATVIIRQKQQSAFNPRLSATPPRLNSR